MFVQAATRRHRLLLLLRRRRRQHPGPDGAPHPEPDFPASDPLVTARRRHVARRRPAQRLPVRDLLGRRPRPGQLRHVAQRASASRFRATSSSVAAAASAPCSPSRSTRTWPCRAAWPSSTAPRAMRVVPDVAAVGDPETGFLIDFRRSLGHHRRHQPVGCPMFAGIQALASQGRRFPIGFANPLLYVLGLTSVAFHDVQAPESPVAIMTQLGSHAAHARPGHVADLDQGVRRHHRPRHAERSGTAPGGAPVALAPTLRSRTRGVLGTEGSSLHIRLARGLEARHHLVERHQFPRLVGHPGGHLLRQVPEIDPAKDPLLRLKRSAGHAVHRHRGGGSISSLPQGPAIGGEEHGVAGQSGRDELLPLGRLAVVLRREDDHHEQRRDEGLEARLDQRIGGRVRSSLLDGRSQRIAEPGASLPSRPRSATGGACRDPAPWLPPAGWSRAPRRTAAARQGRARSAEPAAAQAVSADLVVRVDSAWPSSLAATLRACRSPSSRATEPAFRAALALREAGGATSPAAHPDRRRARDRARHRPPAFGPSRRGWRSISVNAQDRRRRRARRGARDAGQTVVEVSAT